LHWLKPANPIICIQVRAGQSSDETRSFEGRQFMSMVGGAPAPVTRAQPFTQNAAGICSILLFFTCAAKAAPPPQLYGKSVVVAWTDEVVLAPIGGQFHRSSHPTTMSVYVSSQGRPFVRFTTNVHQAVGVRETVGTAGPQTVAFQGRALLVTTAYEGGASRVQIDFDGSFASCTAAVVTGKASGVGAFVKSGEATDRTWVVQSRVAGPASCSIKDGNVFSP
jgi:hypothetical protein